MDIDPPGAHPYGSAPPERPNSMNDICAVSGRAEDRDMVNDFTATAEFSRPVPVDQIGGQEIVREIEASPAERAAVAQRLDLIALRTLRATLRLRRRPDGLIRVSGRFAAEPVQRCVVSLEPVPARCDEELDLLYGESAAVPQPGAEIEIEIGAAGEPEPIEDGRIDLGEAVVQELAVNLDPYPRAPGAEIPDQLAAPGGEVRRKHPFAALGKLKGETLEEEALEEEKPKDKEFRGGRGRGS